MEEATRLEKPRDRGEHLDYKELQSDRVLLNYVFDAYRSCRPFLRLIHLTLDYWHPYQYSEGWKQDPDVLDSDPSEDNLEGEVEEALGQITGIPSKGDAAEKGQPKTFRSAQHWFSELQVLEKLTRGNDPPLQRMRPTQIALAPYGLRDAYKGGFGSVISMLKEGSDCMEDGPGRFHARHVVWCE